VTPTLHASNGNSTNSTPKAARRRTEQPLTRAGVKRGSATELRLIMDDTGRETAEKAQVSEDRHVIDGETLHTCRVSRLMS
jgi:hypothetical protein